MSYNPYFSVCKLFKTCFCTTTQIYIDENDCFFCIFIPEVEEVYWFQRSVSHLSVDTSFSLQKLLCLLRPSVFILGMLVRKDMDVNLHDYPTLHFYSKGTACSKKGYGCKFT